MKVLQIGMGWFPEQLGGLNRIFYGCYRHLPRQGVEFFGLVANSLEVDKDTEAKIQSFSSKEASLLSRWWRGNRAARRFIAKTRPDLVAGHFALYSFPMLPHLRDYPFVMHFHGPWALEGGAEGNRGVVTWLKKQIELPTYRQANRFIVLSEAFRQVLHQEYGVALEKIHIVPGGVDLERFEVGLSSQEARAQLGWPLDRPILLVVRRLARRMGLENLIDAIALVKRQHPDVLLLVAGKGALQAELQAQIEALDLQDSVRLLGFVPDEQLPLAYRAATFSVVPTVALEGFGLVVIESLAAGTPVMGTPIGGIPEILAPFSSDLLFESPAVEHLAAGIAEALSGIRSLPDGEACRAYAAAKYAWPVVAQQIKAVYELAIADKAKAS